MKVELVGDDRSLNRALGRSQKNMGTFGKYAKRAGLAVAAGFGAGVAGTAKATVDFDKSMRNVNSIAQVNEKQFQKLSKSVLGLAGPTAQAPKDLAEGMYDLVSSGFNSAESLQILGKSAKAATAGLTTAETSTKAVAAVLNAYQLPAKQAGKVSDQLFRTVDRGVISFEELAGTVGDVLPFAASLGVGLDQVGASISTMTKAGISAPETMTRIKSIMQGLLKPSTDLKDTLKEQGFASGEALIKAKGFQGALELLAKTTGGSKAEMAKLFPNVRALGGALALTGKNAKTAQTDIDGLRNASGATERALAQQSKSISYMWNQGKAAVTAWAITLGSKAVPVIAQFVSEVRNGTGAGGQFRSVLTSMVGAVTSVGGAVGGVALGLAKLTGGFLSTKAGVATLTAVIGGLVGRMTALAAVWATTKVVAFASAIMVVVRSITTAIAITTSLRAALALLTASMAANPFGAIAIAVGAVVGAFIALRGTTQTTKVTTEQLTEAFRRQVDAMRAVRDIDLDLAQRKANVRSANVSLAASEKRLSDLRAAGKGKTLEGRQAEADLRQARVQASRATRDLGDVEVDSKRKRQDLTQATREAQKVIRNRIAAIKDEQQGLKYLQENSNLTADQVRRLTDHQRKLREELNRLESKRIDVSIQFVSSGLSSIQNAIDSIVPRRGGGMTAGLAAVSPGEMLAFPDGRTGMVPGARTAADSVLTSLPAGTAVFTGHGQSMLAAGASMGQALASQLPHFRKGGIQDFNKRYPEHTLNNTKGKAQLSSRQVRAIGEYQGFSPGLAKQMDQISRGESVRYPGIRQIDPGDGNVGYGLLQMTPNAWGSGTLAQKWLSQLGGIANMLNPVKNMRMAKLLSDDARRATGDPLKPWKGTKYLQPFDRGAKSVKGMFGVAPGQKGGRRGTRDRTVRIPPKVSNPLLGNMLDPLVEGSLGTGITAGMEGGSRRPLLTSVLEGILPESTDRFTKKTIPGRPGRPSRPRRGGGKGGGAGGFKPGGGWAGTKNLVMKAIKGIGARRTFKRSVAINGNTNSDHNTWIKNAFAADMSPGSDSEFSTVSRRLGIRARKGSWNTFTNAPLPGFRSQLLWHAPDGSHTDHIHLGIRAMRHGGIHGRPVGPQRRGLRPGGGRPKLTQLRGLGGNPGVEGADKLTRSYARGLRRATPKQLFAQQAKIKALIRKMARDGFTGGERIQARRLRGVLSLVQDELGRDIGRPLGRSDRTQDRIGRRESTLDSQMVLAGIDPESAQGMAVRQGEMTTSLGQLGNRRTELGRAMRIAKRTGDKTAIRQVQAEINEVDDQVLGLKAGMKDLTEATQEAARAAPRLQADAELAMASLTETLEDDKAALEKLVAIDTERYNEAVRSGDPQAIIDAVSNLKGSQDGLKSVIGDMTQDLKAVAEEMKGLKDELKRQNDFSVSVANVTSKEAVRALADIVSGGIGATYSQRRVSAGTGSLARW